MEATIVKQLEQPVERTFFVGDVAVEETFNNAIPLLLACYRQRQIKLTLQGQIDLEDESEDDEINVIRDFLESKLKHSDQDK